MPPCICDTGILKHVPGGTPGTAGEDARAPPEQFMCGVNHGW